MASNKGQVCQHHLVSLPMLPLEREHVHIQQGESFHFGHDIMSQGVRMIPWKVLGPGDDNSESINTLKVYCP